MHWVTLLHYILVWAEMCHRKYNRNSKVYFLISVNSCVCSDFEDLYFLVQLWVAGRIVMVWQGAALPMSRYIVRKTTTRTMQQSHASYLRTSWPLGALWLYVSMEFRSCAHNSMRLADIVLACLSSKVRCKRKSSQFHFWAYRIYCKR
jgi:hypothetical protein